MYPLDFEEFLQLFNVKEEVLGDLKNSYERKSDSFTWLWKAGVELPVFNSTEPTVPLMINKKSSLYENVVAQELSAHGYDCFYSIYQ